MMNKNFWIAALIRALRTICQAAVALIPAAVTITQVDWLTVLGSALLAGVVSLLTSIATGLPEVDPQGEAQQNAEPQVETRIVYLNEEDRPPDGEGRIAFLNNEE